MYIFNDYHLFRKIINLLKEELETGNFIYTEKGLHIAGIDLSYVMFIYTIIPKELFTKYPKPDISIEDNKKIYPENTVHIFDLDKMLSNMTEKKIKIGWDILDNKYVFKVKNIKSTLVLNGYEKTDSSINAFNQIESQCISKFTFTTKMLKDITDKSKIYSELISFTIKNNILTVSGENSKGDSYEIIYKVNTNDCYSFYGSKLLSTINKASKLDKSMKAMMFTNGPMVCILDIEGITLKMCMAPREPMDLYDE